MIRNTPYGKRIQNKLQREHNDIYGGGGGGGYHHNQQALVNMALGSHGMGALGHGPASAGRHISHLQAGALADAYTAQNGLYPGALQGAGPAGLHGALHGLQSIDSYVMQGSNNHSPGLTPPHTHAGAFSGVSSYGNAFPVGVADPYQRQSFAYGM